MNENGRYETMNAPAADEADASSTTSARTGRRTLSILGPALASVFVLGLGACARASPGGGSATEAEMSRADTAQRGAEIWAATCYRCHNVRPATQYSAEEWPVIMDHMRTRAHLTRSDTEAVSAFLQEVAEQAAR